MVTPAQAQASVTAIMSRVDTLTADLATNFSDAAGRPGRRELIQETANELLNHGISQEQVNDFVNSSTHTAHARYSSNEASGGTISNFLAHLNPLNDTSQVDRIEREAVTAEQRRNNLRGSIIQRARDTASQRASITPTGGEGSLMASVVPEGVNIGKLTASSPTGTTLAAVLEGRQENAGGPTAPAAAPGLIV